MLCTVFPKIYVNHFILLCCVVVCCGALLLTVYPKKYAHGFVVLCFVVVMQSSIMNSLEVFIHIHQGCFAGTEAIVRLPQCQWSKPGGYGKISQCITTTKHSKAKTVCIFLGIYCTSFAAMGLTCDNPSVKNTAMSCQKHRETVCLHICYVDTLVLSRNLRVPNMFY